MNWQECSIWNWHNFTQVTLARLSPSDTGTIVPKWHWNNCCQVTLARLSKLRLIWLFPSGTGTVVIKWRYHNCYWVTMAHFSTSDTGMIVPKWHWDDCSHVILARLFPSSTGSIIPKVHCHNYSQVRLARLFQSGDWLSNLYFFFLQFILWRDSSVMSLTWKKLCNVPGLWHLIPIFLPEMKFYLFHPGSKFMCKQLFLSYRDKFHTGIRFHLGFM